ncbi:alpha/beta hydrolase [Novosphingobium sp. SG707]|uniref:alpha/beta fold hydrolase n=1 Tax=Novosphingobium sp. SG707 TaxID=2586996 RepID=UPI001447065B|nr:alpha/beta hydrolase [Novosphingobium sp. SG707]NKI98269.1 pimeloyl-ACP methyl ester carboxylesterase [Novosphingobium sp. SG707]
MRRAYADGPFGQIHYQYASGNLAGGARPLVLLHQAIMASGQFDHVFAPLIAHGFAPIAIDMPGFGLSDAPPAAPAIADYARCVVPVLDALGVGRAAVAGHHTGALVGTEFALAAPDRIEALVIHGPMILPDEERKAFTDDICAREIAFAARAEGAHFVEVARIRERLSQGRIAPDRITDYVVQAMQAYRMGAYAYGHGAAFAYDHTAPLQRLALPVLILSNTGDMTHPWAQAARALRPDFAYAEIAGGGIDICDEDPQGWADAIAVFLKSL